MGQLYNCLSLFFVCYCLCHCFSFISRLLGLYTTFGQLGEPCTFLATCQPVLYYWYLHIMLLILLANIIIDRLIDWLIASTSHSQFETHCYGFVAHAVVQHLSLSSLSPGWFVAEMTVHPILCHWAEFSFNTKTTHYRPTLSTSQRCHGGTVIPGISFVC